MSSTVIETLDQALPYIEGLVDKALLHEYCHNVHFFTELDTRALTEKVASLFPDGYATGEDDFDQYFWPAVAELVLLREKITPAIADSMAEEWLRKQGYSDDSEWADLPEFPKTPGPMRARMKFARIVGSHCTYIDFWVEDVISGTTPTGVVNEE